MGTIATRLAVLDPLRAAVPIRIRGVGAGVMSTAAGQDFTLYDLTGIPAGVTPVWSLNDGRVGIAGNEADGWRVARKTSAISPGRITGTVTAPPAMPVTLGIEIIDALNPVKLANIGFNAEVPSFYTNDRMFIDAMRTCAFNGATVNKYGIPITGNFNSSIQVPSTYNEALTLNNPDAFIYDVWIEGPGAAGFRNELALQPNYTQLTANGDGTWSCRQIQKDGYDDDARAVLAIDNPTGFTDDTQVHYIRRDLKALYQGGRRINPTVVELWRERATFLRDMDLVGINPGLVTGFGAEPHSGPRVGLTDILELVNLANIDLWHCTHYQYSDQDVWDELSFIKARLVNRLYHEDGNEWFNTDFPIAAWSDDLGQTLFPEVANPFARRTYYAGYRKAQRAKIAASVYADSRHKLHTVLGCWQHGFQILAEMEAGMAKAGVERIEDVFDVLAPGGYARDSMMSLSGASRTLFLQKMTDKDYAWFAAEFAQRTDLASTEDDGVNKVETVTAPLFCAFAASRGIVCIPYEAAHHVRPIAGGFGARQAEANKFVNDAFDAAPMLAVFRRLPEAFIKTRGGAGYGQFTMTNIVEKTCWGATDSPYRRTGKARLEALLAVQTDSQIVRPALQLLIDRAPLLIGAKSKSYLRPSGGTWPYKIEIVSGALPPGITFDGRLCESGTPLGSITPGTTYTRRYRVTDANGQTATLDVSSTVAASPTPATNVWINSYARRGPLNPGDYVTIADVRIYGLQGERLNPTSVVTSTGTAASAGDDNRATVVQGVPLRVGFRFASPVQVGSIVIVNGGGGAHEGAYDLDVRTSSTDADILSASAGTVAITRAQSKAAMPANAYEQNGEQAFALPYGAS